MNLIINTYRNDAIIQCFVLKNSNCNSFFKKKFVTFIKKKLKRSIFLNIRIKVATNSTRLWMQIICVTCQKEESLILRTFLHRCFSYIFAYATYLPAKIAKIHFLIKIMKKKYKNGNLSLLIYKKYWKATDFEFILNVLVIAKLLLIWRFPIMFDDISSSSLSQSTII